MKRILMISAFILIYKPASTQTLQTVTNNGPVTTATITVGGIYAGTLNVARPATLVDNGNSISGDLLFTPLNFGAATNGYLKLSYPDNTTARFSMEYDGHIGAGVLRDIQFGKGQTPYLTIKDGGNIGIGTANPTEKLFVNGTIRSNEIRVEGGNWPDYVFEEHYQSTSLSNLENYIKRNKHLPEIPSAKEVKENGISLGEMNAKLLRKIEELTLYLIEKDKQLMNLEERVVKMEKRAKPQEN